MGREAAYEGDERRRVERYSVSLRARWTGKQVWLDSTVTDLSIYGCFVLTDDRIEPGELVKIELLLPDGVVTLWGHVIYKAEEIGFGVRFSPFFPEEERRKLETLVRAESRKSQRPREK
ncbi:MAG: PilZ domain [Acidobacteriota bacterium]|jgi:hypothetical protein|nr:PilZ domain [Acidobacteriota bacterium]MDT7808452.1 PilZ domain [Acidobacteriota bacterium]